MQDVMRDIPLFVEVAKHKSFTLAAERLDIPVSTLSRRIAAMEKYLGVQLLHRNSRNVELTGSGAVFFERCKYIVADAINAYEVLKQNSGTPSGIVRIAIPGDVYHCYLAESFCSFAKKWPEIHLDIYFAERWVDLLTEPFDLDIRVGELPDSMLKARKLATLHSFLYASPALLERYPALLVPQDLAQLPCITLHSVGNMWTLYDGSRSESVSVTPVYTFNSPSISLDFALAGVGVACLTQPMVEPFLESGQLIPVLPEWQYMQTDLHIVMASSQLPARVRLVVDYLTEYTSQWIKLP